MTKNFTVPPPPAGYSIVTKGRSRRGDINWVGPKQGWAECQDIGLDAGDFRALARRDAGGKQALKDIENAKPAEIESAISQAVLKGFGDLVQNETRIKATHGRYVVELPEGAVGEGLQRRWSLRRAHVPDFIRALKRGRGAFS
jgi:hypothetical protein